MHMVLYKKARHNVRLYNLHQRTLITYNNASRINRAATLELNRLSISGNTLADKPGNKERSSLTT